MKITFTPQICAPSDGKPAAYEGTVTLRAMTYDERTELYDSYGLDVGADDAEESGKISAEAEARLRKKSMGFLRHVARQAPQFVEKIEIKRLDDGFVFTKWEELQLDTDMHSAIIEISAKLIGRQRFGGNE